MGGLGNQLIQLAACFSLADPKEMKINVDKYSGATGIITEKDSPDSLKYSWGEKVSIVAKPSLAILYLRRILLSRLLRASLNKRHDSFFRIYRESLRIILSLILSPRNFLRFRLIASNNLGYFPMLNEHKQSILLGYYQSFKYFEAENVKSLFFNLLLEDHVISGWKEIALLEKPLIIHIRRGDYRKEESFGLLSEKYYENAFNYLFNLGEFKSIWVFSDEIDYAKTLISEEWKLPTRYFSSEKYNPVETLEIMRNGTNFIIANSSFSYWAATLSKAKGEHIVCPEPWFKSLEEPADLINPKWHRIKAYWEI
jgi:hypothetical protein